MAFIAAIPNQTSRPVFRLFLFSSMPADRVRKLPSLKFFSMNRIVAVAIGLLLGMTIFFIPELRTLGDTANPFSDFASFYTAANIDWGSLYDLNRQYEVQSRFAPAPAERMAFYFYPPFF